MQEPLLHFIQALSLILSLSLIDNKLKSMYYHDAT